MSCQMCNILNNSWLWRQEELFASGQTDGAELQVCPLWTNSELILDAAGCHILICHHFMSVWCSSYFWVSVLKCWLFRTSWHVNKCKSSKKNSKCWIHWLLPTQLLSMQCCCFWHTSVLHNTFVFFISLHWEQVIVLMGLCVTGASFTIAQSTVPRHSELSIRFQTGFEFVWGFIILAGLLFSVTHLCEVLALKCFHCWRSSFQKVSCPLNTSCSFLVLYPLFNFHWENQLQLSCSRYKSVW